MTMTELFDFLNLIAEEKKVSETSINNTIIPNLHDKIKENSFFSLLESVSNVEPLSDIIIEEKIPSLTDGAQYDRLFKNRVDLFNQPNLPKVAPELKVVTDKLKYLEDWVSKISALGPGSGEVNFKHLDDVDRSTMFGNTDLILRYNPISKKVFFGQLSGDQGSIKSLTFDLTGTSANTNSGMLTWNSDYDCLGIYDSDGTELHVGQEHFVKVINVSANTMLKGTVVYENGATNSNGEWFPTVGKYIANDSLPSADFIGVLTTDILPNTSGKATMFGTLNDFNTTGSDVSETWISGDILYAHPTLAGKLTKVRPTAPNIVTIIATVLDTNSSSGDLLIRPVILPKLYYGSFYSTQNQSCANTSYPNIITINKTAFSSGFHVANNSSIVAEHSGMYNFQFSVQVISSNSSNANYWIWYRKNGVDVPNTATKLSISSNQTIQCPSWNFIDSLLTNDTFTLMWAVDSTNVSLSAPASTSFCPVIPSVIIIATQITL